MSSFSIHLDPIDYVLDSYAVESSPNFPSKFDLNVYGSSNVGSFKSSSSTIELQGGVPCDFDFFCIFLDPYNHEFVPIDSIIDSNFDLHFEFDITMCKY